MHELDISFAHGPSTALYISSKIQIDIQMYAHTNSSQIIEFGIIYGRKSMLW